MKKAALDRRTQELNEIDEREQACHNGMQELKLALHEVADRATRGRAPLHVIEGDTTRAIKIDKLRRSSTPTPPEH